MNTESFPNLPAFTADGVRKYGLDDPIIQAVSARVRYALICLRKGDIEGATISLEVMERCLPIPKRNNWTAAVHNVTAEKASRQAVESASAEKPRSTHPAIRQMREILGSREQSDDDSGDWL